MCELKLCSNQSNSIPNFEHHTTGILTKFSKTRLHKTSSSLQTVTLIIVTPSWPPMPLFILLHPQPLMLTTMLPELSVWVTRSLTWWAHLLWDIIIPPSLEQCPSRHSLCSWERSAGISGSQSRSCCHTWDSAQSGRHWWHAAAPASWSWRGCHSDCWGWQAWEVCLVSCCSVSVVVTYLFPSCTPAVHS